MVAQSEDGCRWSPRSVRWRINEGWTSLVSGIGLPVFFAWLMCGLILALSIGALVSAFVENFPLAPRFGLGNFTNALEPSLLTTILPNTIFVGFGTAAFVTLFALPMAWILFRTDIPYKALWISLMSATVVIPGFVKAMGWIMLINPNMGLINNFISSVTGIGTVPWNIESLWGIAFLQGLMYTPIMFFLLSGPMQALDPSLEEAGAMSGAGQWEILRKVTLPLMWPAILGGLIYVSMLAISVFDVAAMLGGFSKHPVLATAMFLKIQGLGGMTTSDYGVGSVYGLLILAPSALGLYLYFRVIERQHRYAVITGRGYRPTIVSLGRAKPLALLFVIGYLGLSVGFPFLVLLWQSLLPYLQFPSQAALENASFKNYAEVFDYIGSNVLQNTILLVVFASVVTAFFSIMISWVVIKTKIRSRHALDVLAMIPHAVPGLVFAFLILVAAMMARKYLPTVPLYGTLFIVILAHIINRVSYLTRVTNAAFMQVSPELEEFSFGFRCQPADCYLANPCALGEGEHLVHHLMDRDARF